MRRAPLFLALASIAAVLYSLVSYEVAFTATGPDETRAETAQNEQPSPEPAATASAQAGPETIEEDVTLDLLEYLEVAEVGWPMTVFNFDFRNEKEDGHLTSGWQKPWRDGKDEEFAWTKDRDGVVEIPLVRPGPLRFRLKMGALKRHKLLPKQTVEVRWNGHTVDTVTVVKDIEPFDLEIPVEFQRIGPNRLEILPYIWVVPVNLGIAPDMRPLGVKCWKIEFARDPAEMLSKRPAVVKQGAIRQPPGTVITYYFVLPGKAVLQTEGIFKVLEGGTLEGVQGYAAITIVDEDGAERKLVERSLGELAEDPRFAVEEDLSEMAGRMVAVNFSYWLKADDAESVPSPSFYQLEWRKPRIQGVREVLSNQAREIPRGKYNVLIALFDALRGDHIEPSGKKNVATPALEAFAAKGTTFLNAFSNCSYTRCSVASLLSSQYPVAHKTLTSKDRLPTDVPFLPKILQQAGYKTLSLYKNGQVAPELGFGRGYDRLEKVGVVDFEAGYEENAAEKRAEALWNNHVEPFVNEAPDKPFFIYLHEIDPHSPYIPPKPYNKLYDFDYGGRKPGFADFVNIPHVFKEDALAFDEVDVRYYHSQYKGEVAFMDAYFERLLERLEQSGLAKNTLVLFIADHGEEFMEHDGLNHSRTLYEESIHVPMIWALDGVIPAGRRLEAHAELLDVPPTILDLAGVTIPERMQGKSLLPLLNAPEDYMPDRFSIAKLGGNPWDSVRFRDWKMLKFRDTRTTYYLYNIADDPEEKIDRWPQQPIIGKTLLQRLRWQHRLDAQVGAKEANQLAPGEIPNEVEEELRALGYLN